MKRVLTLLTALAVAFSLTAQIKLLPEKENLKDFMGKTTKVVLAGDNTMIDLLLKSAVEKNWYLSPYEFCTFDEFETIKADTSYYFLIRVNGQHNKESEPALEFLSLVKGGPKATKGLDAMPEILTLPLQPINDTEGVIFEYLPAYVKIVQAHILMIIRNNLSAYTGMSTYTNSMDMAKGKKILFRENDFAFKLSAEELNKEFKGKALFATNDEIDSALREGTPETLVSLVIAPTINQRGSYCYKLLISADSQELFFFRKHKVTARNGKGFLMEDYKRIAVPYLIK